MAAGATLCRFVFPPIEVQEDYMSGEAFWSYLDAQFRWYGGILDVRDGNKWVPVVRIALRDQAIQFSLGMIAGSQYWICLGDGPPLH